MTLQITSYEFGKMVIDDQTYTKDLIIYEDTIIENWWRKEGHLLSYLDLRQELYIENPRILVIGTGVDGMMVVPDEEIDMISNLSIITYTLKTPEAMDVYNEMCERENWHPMGAFHLTC